MEKHETTEIVKAGETAPDKERPAPLTAAQERFCQLYVCGGVRYAGQMEKCYKEAFGGRKGEEAARRLTRNPAVMARIRELGAEMISETESIAVKMQISQTLRAILRETSTDIYRDRFGNPLSPAPMRAVAVNAAKALMEMYPIKNSVETKLRIEGDDNNIVFNVIVPRIDHATSDEREG